MTQDLTSSSKDHQSSLLVNRALNEAEKGWFHQPNAELESAPLPSELLTLAQKQWRGRRFLARMIHTGLPFAQPIDTRLRLDIGISGAGMLLWLSRPVKELEPQLLIIGACVMAPVIREQIQRQAVSVWRNLLGEDGYTYVLSRRRGTDAAELRRQSTSVLLQSVIRFNTAYSAGSGLATRLPAVDSLPAKTAETNRGMEYPMLKRNLMYLGLQELWCFLQQFMPVVADRARLLMPPRYFDPQYAVQLKTGEMVSILSSWIAGDTTDKNMSDKDTREEQQPS